MLRPASEPSTSSASGVAPQVEPADRERDRDRDRGSALEQALAAETGSKVWVRRLVLWLVLALVIGAAVVWRQRTRPPPPPKYVVAAVSRGEIVESVQSTGTVQPVTQVQVGAQISGRIARVFVDFNSVVKKGDVLAEIDPTLLGATVEQNRAQLAAAEAQVKRAEASLVASQAALERIERLRGESLSSQADVDQIRGQRDVAQAELAAARAQIVQTRAQLSYSRTNMTYARIYAPIDGLVVSRNIDPGQTVAASFQSPTLFVIAQDLRKMRILAEIDEADVGKLREGMAAEASVDAFSGEAFSGAVTQVRYNPNTVQGVVTYLAVVEVQNPEMKLRPGMTATVLVKTREAKDVARVPNAALRYRPTPPKDAKDAPPKELVIEPRAEPLGRGKARLHVLSDATPGRERAEPRVVEVGITDGVQTELRGNELAIGSKVIVDETDQADDKKRGPRLF